jgi:hypothetical protein
LRRGLRRGEEKVNDGDEGKEGTEEDVQATRKKTISRSETTVASRERGAYEEEEKKSVSPVANNNFRGRREVDAPCKTW